MDDTDLPGARTARTCSGIDPTTPTCSARCSTATYNRYTTHRIFALAARRASVDWAQRHHGREQGGARDYEFYLLCLSFRGEAGPSGGMAVMDFASIWSRRHEMLVPHNPHLGPRPPEVMPSDRDDIIETILKR